MTVTYGFYDSLNGDRKYNARQMSQIFKGIITDGVFQSIGQGFGVSAPGLMNVSVGSGRAWLNYTWTDNDAALLVPILASEPVLPRIDTVVIEVNTDTAVRANSIKVIKGTPASSPVAPTMANTATLKQYPLADIWVAAGVSSIGSGNIVNRVGIPGGTPFATGAVPGYDFGPLLTSWQTQFSDWFNNLVDQLSGSQVANLQAQIDVLTANINQDNSYVITPTINAGQLTVSLKTINGTDPSASDPLLFRVGNIEYVVASAFSFTVPSGQNWFNSGSLELDNQNVDYFVYLVSQTGSGAGIKLGIARIPYARVMGQFDLGAVANFNFLYSNVSQVNAGDSVAVIGRFRATLWGGTWSIPQAVVINRPIYESDWMNYVGVSSVSSGTFGSTNTVGSLYKINGTSAEYRPHLGITDQGSSSGTPYISTVFPVGALTYWGLGRENAISGKVLYLLSDTNRIGMTAMDGSPTCVTGYNLDGHIVTRITGTP